MTVAGLLITLSALTPRVTGGGTFVDVDTDFRGLRGTTGTVSAFGNGATAAGLKGDFFGLTFDLNSSSAHCFADAFCFAYDSADVRLAATAFVALEDAVTTFG